MTEYHLTLEEAKLAMKNGFAVQYMGSHIDYFYSKRMDDFYFISADFTPCFFLREPPMSLWKVSLTKEEATIIKVEAFKSLNKFIIEIYLEGGESDEKDGN